MTKRRALMTVGAGLHLGLRDEAPELADDVDAEALEPLLAVDGGDGVDDAGTWSLAAAKSGSGAWPATPKASPVAVSCALWPAASSALDGTQP
jgi:hypothetical protein